MAHELFHTLTWEAMPPQHAEDASDFDGNRTEQLANNFALAMLMPSSALQEFDDCARLDMDGLAARLNAVADELRVTSSALRWRIAALWRLTKAKAKTIPEGTLRNNGHEPAPCEPPPLFSKPFAELLTVGKGDDFRFGAPRLCVVN